MSSAPAPAAKPPKVSFYLQVMQQVAAWRAQLARFFTTLPYWPELERVSMVVAGPVKAIARRTLITFPALRKAEWLLEIEALTRRHPVGLAFSVCYTAWVGLMPSTFGHIATNITIYPFLGVVSGFNPFLGLLCAFAYGIADLAQKLFWNDIYGAGSRLSLDYWGAMLGYVFAYSSLAIMGVLPGFTSRVSRYAMRVALNTLFYKRTAASADGAAPFGGDPGFAMDFHDPKYKAMVLQLQKDPRHLLNDLHAWERARDLTPMQRLVLTQLRQQGLLGPDSADLLNQFWSEETAGAHPKPSKPTYYEYCPQQQNPPIPSDYRVPEGIDDPFGQPPPGPPEGSGGGGAGTYPLAEMLAGIFGGVLGGAATMYFIAPATEAPAFYLRPHSDDSCHQLEVNTYLRGMAPAGGLAGGVGGAGPDVAPPPGSAPPGTPPQDVTDFFNRWNRASAVNLNTGNDPWVNEQLNNQMKQFEDTGRFDPNGMDNVERRLGEIDQNNAGQFEDDSNAAIDRSNAERDRNDAAEAGYYQYEQGLVDEYNNLLDRAGDGGDLESKLGRDTLDNWHDRVVNPDGTVNSAELEKMKLALELHKHDEAQQQMDGGDPGADPNRGAAAGRQRLTDELHSLDPGDTPVSDTSVEDPLPDSPADPVQAKAIQDYNDLVNRLREGGDLDSVAGNQFLDQWHDRVIHNGVVDSAALEQMKNDLELWKHNELQGEIDRSQAIYNAESNAATVAGGLETGARIVRNTAFAVDSGLLTGGVTAAAGGIPGAIAGTGAGIGASALTGGVNAMSDAGKMDASTFGDGAWQGTKQGLVSTIAGGPTAMLAQKLGVNPWVASAVVGGVANKAAGGSFLEGAGQGVLSQGLSNLAGNAVNRGGWNSDVQPADALQHPVAPTPTTPDTTTPETTTPPGPVESRWGSPQSDPWGRAPAPRQPDAPGVVEPGGSAIVEPAGPETPAGSNYASPRPNESVVDHFANMPLEDLQHTEQAFRNAGDTENADLINQAIQKRIASGVPEPPPQYDPEISPGNVNQPHDFPSALRAINPEDLPQPGQSPTDAQMNRLYNYDPAQLEAARNEALQAGDTRTAWALQHAQREQGYLPEIDPSTVNIPQPGDLPHISDMQNLVNHYSVEQLNQAAKNAEAAGNQQAYDMFKNAAFERWYHDKGPDAFWQPDGSTRNPPGYVEDPNHIDFGPFRNELVHGNKPPAWDRGNATGPIDPQASQPDSSAPAWRRGDITGARPAPGPDSSASGTREMAREAIPIDGTDNTAALERPGSGNQPVTTQHTPPENPIGMQTRHTPPEGIPQPDASPSENRTLNEGGLPNTTSGGHSGEVPVYNPDDFRISGARPTNDQLQRLYDNYSVPELRQAQLDAAARGDTKASMMLQNVLAHKGDNPVPNLADVPGHTPGQLTNVADLERIAQNYTPEQIRAAHNQALAAGDQGQAAVLQDAANERAGYKGTGSNWSPEGGSNKLRSDGSDPHVTRAGEPTAPPDAQTALLENHTFNEGGSSADPNITLNSPPLSKIDPNALPQPGRNVTDSQMDSLYANQSTPELAAAQRQAYQQGDYRTSAALQNVLAAKGHEVPVSASDIPALGRGELPNSTDIDRLANQYTYDQLRQKADELRAIGAPEATTVSAAADTRRNMDTGEYWPRPDRPLPHQELDFSGLPGGGHTGTDSSTGTMQSHAHEPAQTMDSPPNRAGSPSPLLDPDTPPAMRAFLPGDLPTPGVEPTASLMDRLFHRYTPAQLEIAQQQALANGDVKGALTFQHVLDAKGVKTPFNPADAPADPTPGQLQNLATKYTGPQLHGLQVEAANNGDHGVVRTLRDARKLRDQLSQGTNPTWRPGDGELEN